MTRQELSAHCAALAERHPARYTSVSYRAIQNLEGGVSQPRASTARTLSNALAVEIETLFPKGLDFKSRYANKARK